MKNKPAKSQKASRSMCSAWSVDGTNFTWDNRWGAPVEAAAGVYTSGDGNDVSKPPAPTTFQQARRWSRMVGFIGRIQRLRLAFVLHGLLGLVEKPKGKKGDEVEYEWHPGIRAANAKDADDLNEWKKKNAGEIQRVILDLMRERIVTRNAVAVWQPKGKVISQLPEKCKYVDVFGQEALTIQLNLTTEAIQKMRLTDAAKNELLKNPKQLEITRDSSVFSFRVLKDEAMGGGFGWPDTTPLFHFCALEEALVVGDRQLADACRTVYEQHLLGHEIKSGPHAGSPVHFGNESRRNGTLKEVKNATGKKVLITNFDHTIKIGAGRPDANQYDAARYKAVAEHFAIWGAPYAQMWSGVVNPFLMSLARMDAQPERQALQPFFADILRKGLSCPVDVVIQFSDACFWDSRLLLDMLKAGLAGGPVSQGTFLDNAGLRQTDELRRKQFEAQLDEKLVTPAYDAAHGPDKTKSPGKPPGKNDKT